MNQSEEVKNLMKWDFNILAVDDIHQKQQIVIEMFERGDYFNKYKIKKFMFTVLLRETARYYNKRNNPFHNFNHAVNGKNDFV